VYSNYTRQEPVKSYDALACPDLKQMDILQNWLQWAKQNNFIFAVSEKASRESAVTAQGCVRKKWKEVYHQLLHSNSNQLN